MSISSLEIQDLRLAKGLLENPGLAVKISHVVGTPIEKGFRFLPEKWKPMVVDATRKSIEAALDVALRTIDSNSTREPSDWWHKVAVGTTGAAGGAFGLAALVIELPVSTTIMLRSIADIARSEGEDIRAPDSKVECIQVLALGGESQKDDAAETGYFAARAAMAKAVSDALRHIAEKGIVEKGAPAIVHLITAVASRFSISVSEKAAAQAIPILGAVGGALINTMFINHFQRMARGHFIVRRLERVHGMDEVRRVYHEL
jgi:EcsC family protein